MELIDACKKAIEAQLTIAEFAYLYFLFTSNNEGKELIFNRLKQESKNRLKRKYLDAFGDLTEEARDLFKEKGFDSNELFEEFYREYPNVATRIDGTVDVLRVNKTLCEQLYGNIIKNVEQHQHIVLCLKAQLQYFKLANKMQYFRRMLNWLKNEEWLVGEALMTEYNIEQKTKQYGDEVE